MCVSLYKVWSWSSIFDKCKKTKQTNKLLSVSDSRGTIVIAFLAHLLPGAGGTTSICITFLPWAPQPLVTPLVTQSITCYCPLQKGGGIPQREMKMVIWESFCAKSILFLSDVKSPKKLFAFLQLTSPNYENWKKVFKCTKVYWP